MRRRSPGAEKRGPARSFAAAKNTRLPSWLLHPLNCSGRRVQMGRGGQVVQVRVKTIRVAREPQRQTGFTPD